MMRYLSLFVLVFGFTAARADDSIRITYSSGYPMPGYSTEDSEIAVSRKSVGPTRPSQSDIDRYFDSVRRVLESANSGPAWEPPPALHADVVKVEIVLGARKYLFSASYGAKGPQIPL